MSLINKPKAELIELIRELQDKLAQVKNVEKQLNAEAKDLPNNAVGLHKDENGNFSLVKIKYDPQTQAVAIEQLEQIETKDQAIVLDRLKRYVGDNIFRKALGGKYV